MNVTGLTGVALEKALAQRLRELLGSVPWLRDWQIERNPAAFDRAFDIEAVLPLPGGVTAELWVECRSDPRPSQFPYVVVTNDFQPQGKRRTRIPVFATSGESASLTSPGRASCCRGRVGRADAHWRRC